MRSPERRRYWTVDITASDPLFRPQFIALEMFTMEGNVQKSGETYIYRAAGNLSLEEIRVLAPVDPPVLAEVRLLPPTARGVRLAVRAILLEPYDRLPTRLLLRMFEESQNRLQVQASQLFRLAGPKDNGMRMEASDDED